MAGRLSLLRRLTASTHHLDAAALADEIGGLDRTPIEQLRRGDLVTVAGRLRAVVYTPSEFVPTFVAQLYDGTGSLELVWLGQRRIPGIEPGRRLVARGRVGLHERDLAIYNPWYDLGLAGA